MQGAEERRLRRINNTSQGEATESNTADDSLMVDQVLKTIPWSSYLGGVRKAFPVVLLILKREINMASHTKKAKKVRGRKQAPNKVNLMANKKRIEKNAEILRKLAERDPS